MSATATRTPPDALLLMGTHCPYCPTVLKELNELVRAGHIGKLDTCNIEENPEIARELGVRSVPWVRIGPFELEGLRSKKELREWAGRAGTEAGMAVWLDELLSSGKIDKAMALVHRDPATLNALLLLFSDPDTRLNTRIGISAIMEDLEGSALLEERLEKFGELTRHPAAHIRGDACHYLALTGSHQASAWIRPLLDDPDPDIRQIARDSLEHLEQTAG